MLVNLSKKELETIFDCLEYGLLFCEKCDLDIKKNCKIYLNTKKFIDSFNRYSKLKQKIIKIMFK